MYFIYFLLAVGVSAALTPLVRFAAVRFGIVDAPTLARKIHTKPIPFLGGLAVFLTTVLVCGLYALSGRWDFTVVPLRFAVGILLGGLLLMLGGVLDDKYNLPAKITWVFPAVASAIVIYSGVGVGITFLTNPLGGQISLLGHFLGVPVSILFLWVWMMGMTYTTKLLDGLDGLAAGVSLIGGLVMFALSLTDKINQPITAMFSIVFVGALLGYLFYAFNPASIFLGEEGSTFLGFFLAALSVLTGAKIATAVLVMGIPILDVAWAILRRLSRGKSPFSADREHLHFLLLDSGLSQRQAVLVYYVLAAIFGFFAVFLQSMGKLLALFLLLAIMVGLVGGLASIFRKKRLSGGQDLT